MSEHLRVTTPLITISDEGIEDLTNAIESVSKIDDTTAVLSANGNRIRIPNSIVATASNTTRRKRYEAK